MNAEPSTVQKVYQVVSHRPLCFWTENDVDEWLRRRRPKLALKYGELFVRHRVHGRVLMELTDADMSQMGIDNFDERSSSWFGLNVFRQEILLEVLKEKLYSDLDELSKLRNLK